MTEKQYNYIQKTLKIILSLPMIYATMIVGWLVFTEIQVFRMIAAFPDLMKQVTVTTTAELVENSIKNLVDYWDNFRQVGYILSIIVLLIGVALVFAFRQIEKNKVVKYEDPTRLKPKTNFFLPVSNFVISLLLLTFSYAIAKFIVELLITTQIIKIFFR